MSLLDIEKLDLDIHASPILRDISLSIDAGQIVGVIGESGSGKSMTAYSVMQLLPDGARTNGQIKLNGQDVVTASEDEMCRLRGQDIAMVFQEPMTALNPVKTIGEQVAETIRVHTRATRSDARQIARHTLDRVGLPAQEFPLSRYPHELSGGQRQRVVIAMAIALRPKLLIADEPTTALDVTTQAQIIDLLKRLVREDNMGLMMITHDLAVVSDMADDIVILKSGEVVEAGATGSLLHTMKHAYTKALFEASGHVPDWISRIPTTDAPLLDVSNVSRDYALSRTSLFGKPKLFRAVDNVSFSIQRGESLGLVGESGCGKSTLTRAILGLDAVQEGNIRIDAAPVFSGTKVNRLVRRKIQAVFQDPYGSFNPRHRVSRLIAEPFHLLDDPPKGQDREDAVAEALESVGLNASDATRYIHEFSGGQRQRIAIARALVIKPDLIILDEAVSALDVSIRAQILDLLADLSARLGLTYLFISHDLSVVRAITDRVLVMKSGSIVEQGGNRHCFYRPAARLHKISDRCDASPARNRSHLSSLRDIHFILRLTRQCTSPPGVSGWIPRLSAATITVADRKFNRANGSNNSNGASAINPWKIRRSRSTRSTCRSNGAKRLIRTWLERSPKACWKKGRQPRSWFAGTATGLCWLKAFTVWRRAKRLVRKLSWEGSSRLDCIKGTPKPGPVRFSHSRTLT